MKLANQSQLVKESVDEVLRQSQDHQYGSVILIVPNDATVEMLYWLKTEIKASLKLHKLAIHGMNYAGQSWLDENTAGERTDVQNYIEVCWKSVELRVAPDPTAPPLF